MIVYRSPMSYFPSIMAKPLNYLLYHQSWLPCQSTLQSLDLSCRFEDSFAYLRNIYWAPMCARHHARYTIPTIKVFTI
jgi:hypothetical protein